MLLSLSQDLPDKNRTQTTHLAKLQAVILASDALANKWPHLHIYHKLPLPRSCSLQGKEPLESLTLKIFKYKSKSCIYDVLRPQYKALLRHPSFSSELHITISNQNTHYISHKQAGLLENAFNKTFRSLMGHRSPV